MAIPFVAPTVARAKLLLLHVPPVVALLNVVDTPTHTADVPEIAAGTGYTVTALIAMQPVPVAYEIFTVPAAIPAAVPEVTSTVATEVLLLLQFPPRMALLNTAVDPVQKFVTPTMADGAGLILTTATALHPVLTM